MVPAEPEHLGIQDGKEDSRRVRRIPLELMVGQRPSRTGPTTSVSLLTSTLAPRLRQKLFARMSVLDQESMSLKALTESFGWERNQQVIQHDVQELNRVLFDALEQVRPPSVTSPILPSPILHVPSPSQVYVPKHGTAWFLHPPFPRRFRSLLKATHTIALMCPAGGFLQSLVGSPADSLIRDLYAGSMLNIVQCLECGTASTRPEAFHDVSVPVAGHSSLLSG